jgi:hypothetical protein
MTMAFLNRLASSIKARQLYDHGVRRCRSRRNAQMHDI